MSTEEKNTQTEAKRDTHRLAEPFTWEGKTYEEFVFQFQALTGSDMLAIEQEMTMVGEGIALTPEYSTAFTYRLAARAAGVPADVIQHLPFPEFNAVRRMARNFMLRR